MSTTTAPRAAAPSRPPLKPPHTCRPGRPARPLHGDPLPRGARRLGDRRGRARVLRPSGRAGSLGRRLGSQRLAVGAGAQADRKRLRRPRKLLADHSCALAVADVRRPGLPLDRGPSRASAARDPRGEHGHRTSPRASRSPPTVTPRSSRRAPRGTPTRWFAAADSLKGPLPALHGRVRSPPDRGARHVVGLQRSQPQRDVALGGDLLARDPGDHAAGLRLAGRRRAAPDADDDRPAGRSRDPLSRHAS